MSKTFGVLTIAVNGAPYVFNMEHVVEILTESRITKLPLMPKGLVGIMDRHGHSIPLIDLRIIADGRTQEGGIVVVVRLPDERDFGVLVDSVGSTTEVNKTYSNPLGESPNIITGFVKIEETTYPLLTPIGIAKGLLKDCVLSYPSGDESD